ncbi:diacylglycerol kinase epsilon isoform X1 [Apis mellifera caucasica]|uniref:Diacylglycerol kinase n=1 Tax=Apis mellifera TaxID=7460 RepID=A0A7M7L395_APIME|nr:diacylglycerol kinase epsilon isoform X1 [Apis mellifera]KAG6802050.1 diacylglycerol kinase epsilon isoform X1 [Apis mellifera caucasica]KAG9432391.1 diacylglycerol kinase epsilon isoform X1 [Apis mellifera carnica]|eukprot:XP_026295888.1 diacylglycerol kinase epsilon isoform X1 [Apis mellifera]
MLEDGVTTTILCTFFIIFFVLILNFFQYLARESYIHIRDVTKEHNWKSIKKENKAYYCSICESLLLNLNGLICDSCGVCADPTCVKIADKQLKCKIITTNINEPMNHHWIKGNLPLNVICDICNEDCDMEPGLTDWWCCWCHRCVHDNCKSKLSKICDFGKFKLMIIPPSSLEVINLRNTVRRRLRLCKVIPPNWPQWNPLIVVANKKSGNNDGAEILSLFRRLLNPAQVVDLSECDAVAILEWCRLLGKVTCTLLVAGGDGTIASLLNAIHKVGLKPIPSVAIIPLGTGNDLSRVLGWGKEHDLNKEPEDILQEIQVAEKVELDRWTVIIKPYGGLGLRSSRQIFYMYNYLSVGVDAQVTLNFHRTRKSRFYFYSSRLLNKLLYLCFGMQQVVERECKDLNKNIELYLDDKKINLPSIESIVILNIPSWAAGVNLWNMGLEGHEKYSKQSINDGKLEIVALYSSFHMAQLQVGLSQPYRLGQANSVKVKIIKSCAMQIDGEPWYQHPCEFNIKYCNKATILMNSIKKTI